MDYTKPSIVEVGDLETLTLRTKALGSPYDGDRLQNGGKLTTVS